MSSQRSGAILTSATRQCPASSCSSLNTVLSSAATFAVVLLASVIVLTRTAPFVSSKPAIRLSAPRARLGFNWAHVVWTVTRIRDREARLMTTRTAVVYLTEVIDFRLQLYRSTSAA